MAKYFFRLDDIAPNMNWDNFNSLAAIFKKYGIKPLFAVIPDNKDVELLKYPYNPDFWGIISRLNGDGWIIAQHGYQHLYNSVNGGILNINKKSEFSGLDYDAQIKMIKIGKDIIATQIGESKVFVAPAHSFDKNTIGALAANNFRFISDGIALHPFKKWGIIWLPQILWQPRKLPFGLITIALHPNTLKPDEINSIDEFISKNRDNVGNFSELIRWHSNAKISKKLFLFFADTMFRPIWRLIFKIKHGLSK